MASKAKPHKGVVVKVNAIVDERIAPLVLALNRIPCVFTVESCQGKAGRPAWVYFRYLGPEQNEPAFFADLARSMASNCGGELLYKIRLEWNSGEQPLGIIECSLVAVERVAGIVNAASRNVRMTPYLHGNARKARRKARVKK